MPLSLGFATGLLVSCACCASTYQKAIIGYYASTPTQRKIVTISDPKQVKQLASYFPGLGWGGRADLTLSWIPPYDIAFVRANGQSDYVETDGKFETRPGFLEYVKPLLETATTAPTTN
jgi:hypothetical protein